MGKMKVVSLAICLPVVFGARPYLSDAVDLRGASPDSADTPDASVDEPAKEKSDEVDMKKLEVDASLEPATQSIADASEKAANREEKVLHQSRVKREAGLAEDAKQEVGGKIKRHTAMAEQASV